MNQCDDLSIFGYDANNAKAYAHCYDVGGSEGLLLDIIEMVWMLEVTMFDDRVEGCTS